MMDVCLKGVDELEEGGEVGFGGGVEEAAEEVVEVGGAKLEGMDS